MGTQVVKKKTTKKDDSGVTIFQLPTNINVIAPSKLQPVIRIKNNVIEVDNDDKELLIFVRGIEGAQDITATVNSYRGD